MRSVEVLISNEDIDMMVVEELKNAYRINAVPNKIDCSDDIIPIDQEFLNSVDHVLEYFLNYEQLKEWKQEKAEL
jgi:hypothetical protein